MKDSDAIIAHVDMDAFFARVEKKDNPELEDEPVVVGGLGSRGVVSTACYVAREYGIHSAMPMSQARDLCPSATFLSPRSDRYRDLSKRIREIVREVTPHVNPVSLDEAYLDVSGVIHQYETAGQLAEQLRDKIIGATDLTASVGVGPNKMIAKLASDEAKPDGSKVVESDELLDFLAPLDVESIPGFGPETCKKMNQQGIETLGDIQDKSRDEMIKTFGPRGLVYFNKARGEGKSELSFGEQAKSISHEETYEDNLTDEQKLLNRLNQLTAKVGRRLRDKNLEARTIFLKERRGDFTTFTRQRTVADYVQSTETIWNWVKRIFLNDVTIDSRGIRLQGVGVTNLRQQDVQTSLFEDTKETRQELNDVVDDINREFGADSVVRARNLEDPDKGVSN